MFALLLLGCTSTPWCTASGRAFDTTWRARWQARTCEAEGALVERKQDLEGKLSVWIDGSEIRQVSGAFRKVGVSEDTARVVRLALDLAADSGGAFDPTLEPLMIAWGVRDGKPERPSDADLAAAVEQVGWEAVEVGVDAGVPFVHPQGRQLDVSGVDEGYLADRLSFVLSRHGHGDHLVQVGDEVRVQGHGPNGTWMVGAPDGSVVGLVNLGMGSTGGQGTTTTFDPKTGEQVQRDAARVVVVAGSAAEADGLATAVRVLGVESGLALLERRVDVEGMIVDADGRAHQTSGMDAFLEE